MNERTVAVICALVSLIIFLSVISWGFWHWMGRLDSYQIPQPEEKVTPRTILRDAGG